MKKHIILFLILTLLFAACNHNKQKDTRLNEQNIPKIDSLYKLPEFKKDTFRDKRDNTLYNTIQIGEQIWCSDNINFKTNSNSHKKYRNGLLYNWKGAQEACPELFTIPSNDDWQILCNYIQNEIINKSSQRLIDSIISLFTSPYNRYSYYCYSMIDENLYLELFLNHIGFSTTGSGWFIKNSGGHDGYTYFWSSSNNTHSLKRFKDFTDGIPMPDGIFCNDKCYFRLKCIKEQSNGIVSNIIKNKPNFTT